MKGILHKTEQGWVIVYDEVIGENIVKKNQNLLPLIDNGHIDGLKLYDSNEGLEVDFEIIHCIPEDLEPTRGETLPFDSVKYARIRSTKNREHFLSKETLDELFSLHDPEDFIDEDSEDWDKQKLVKKWESSGLLEGLKGESSNTDMVKLLKCKATQLLDEPYISDDFQIGPDGAYEHTEEDELKDWDVTLNDGLENDPYISDDFQIGPDGAYEHTQGLSILPREKASELIVNYQLKCKSLDYNEAKQCALIAVEEIIKECYNWNGSDNVQWETKRFEYWQEVKQEIEKL